MLVRSLYAASLYWAIVTITSVGYGDISASNTREQVVLAVMLLLSGIVYAQIVGSMASIASSFERGTANFKDRMDSLNTFMRNERIDKDLRWQVRQQHL